jgi:hypothetical protein
MIATPEVRAALEQLVEAAPRDPSWEDVLRRASRSRRRGLRRRPRVVAAVVVAAVAPAIGAAGIGLAIRDRPGPVATAQVVNGGAKVSASFTAHPGRSFSARGTGRSVGFTRDVVWALTLSVPERARVSARVAYASHRFLLCDPCGAHAQGRAHPRAAWVNIVDGRARLLLEVDGRIFPAPLRVRTR